MEYTTARQRLDEFFATGKEVRYSKRALIVGYYDQPDYAYWIIKGSVKVISCNKEGLERIQHIYEEGELFPIKWLFDQSQFDVAFFALTEVTVRTKPIKEFAEFIHREPMVLLAIIHQQMAILERLINLHIEAAEERVAFGLLSLAGRLGVHEHNLSQGSVCLPLSIQDLGSIIHLSRERTGKVLRKFHREGYVILDHQVIQLFPEKLQQLLND